MKPAPTLIDTLYRLSFRPETNSGWKSNLSMRNALLSARRFVVDAPMSAFMAELANEPFLRAGRGSPLVPRIADSLRVSARLPHEAIWIEYSLHAYQTRANALRGMSQPNLHETPMREGWLIQQHPTIDSAHIMHLFTDDTRPDEHGFQLWTFPFAFAWCSDDNPLPWQLTVALRHEPDPDSEPLYASAVLVGLGDYNRDNVGYVRSPLIDDPQYRANVHAYSYLLEEWTGVIRRVWALLATIDHLPLTKGEVRQSKGFLARGRIRKFLDHTTITLNIPGKRDTRVLARKVIALAHRKRHEVRAHWRDDWRHPPGRSCNPHLWEIVDDQADHIRCELCGGRQTYIRKHERGDASLGYVTHDYAVHHDRAS
jgi:hypothetical protein